MDIEDVELVARYKEKLLDMRIEIIKLKSENQKLRLKTNALIDVREGGNIKIIMKHNKFVEQNNRRK